MKYADFEAKAKKAVAEMSAKVEALPWENKAFYQSWLVQTHAFVEHTPKFLKLCHQKLGPGHALEEQYEEHIREEDGHDNICRKDMDMMGVDFENREIFAETKVFYERQYYWINEVGATSHLGYSLLLEGVAAKAGPTLVKKIKAAGHQGYFFLKVHAEEDDDHFDHALEAVSTLTDEMREHIWTNLQEGMAQYLKICAKCVAHSATFAKAS